MIISRVERGNGWIDTLEPVGGGEFYYRSCAGGRCRYSSDLWQAELYLDYLSGSQDEMTASNRRSD